ncbi:MAG: RNA polymerase subunit sigma-24, partial [Chitinivibrionales bacterium]|nr:RNA polymerase subunit sigma-24 [Chitinivibrionales bacterium]
MSPEMRRSRVADFFTTEYNRLVGYVRTLIDDAAEQDAEDFVQDVAVKLLSLADITAPIENLSAYVYRALRNRVIDAFRVRRRHA